ncbi:MAG: filamentous hemagglutinin family protein [Nevskia sp.]|nr:filamentous hemagglutinin family protein [Nevskia sp.]
MSQDIVDRILRTAPRASASMIYVGAALMFGTLPVSRAWAAGPVHPPLPTPCSGGPCGVNTGNTAFVQSGQVGAPVVNGSNMTVNQTSNSAILNWQNFNIASGYSVKFNQPGTTAAALNRIWSGDPSVISGKLSANGQLYLINQNGIVFNQGAQVNVGSLTASTLDIKDSLFQNGILSGNPNIAQSSTELNPVFTASPNAQAGGVLVDTGAQLSTNGSGGRIVLLGSKVTNNGSISTPDGQTILGAGNTVYLAASTDPALRGLLIEVDSRKLDANGNSTGTASAVNSTVTNTGQITAARGNATLAGLVVNQSGTVAATTSVTANGSVYLVAGDTSNTASSTTTASSPFYNGSSPTAGFGTMLPNNGGTLTLAPGSVTQVLPDSTDTATVSVGNLQQFQPSQVNLVGNTVAVQKNAAIHVPGGNVGITAAANPFQRVSAPGQSSVGSDGSRIYLDSGSSIDVSGLANVEVPVTQNLVQVKLESNDLQGDPLERSGFLHGLNVTVDVSACITAPATCSTLFDLTPYVNNIGLGINQVLTKAGSIKLDSSGDVIARAGSMLNVSGGSVAFQGGYGSSSTQLVGADGKTYGIANAPNTVQYVGLVNGYSYTDPTWGVTTSSISPSYYAGYAEGGAAGNVTVLAPQVYLRGSMEAQTSAGPYQRGASTLPAGGSFTLGDASLASLIPTTNMLQDFRAPSTVLADDALDNLGSNFDPLAGSALPTGLASSTVVSATQLAQNGFTSLAFHSNGTVSLGAGEDLKLGGGGSFTATGQSIEIDGRIDAPGGNVSLQTTQFTAGLAGPANDITLGPGAAISVAGSWINDSPLLGMPTGTVPLLYNGGNISLLAENNVVLGDNSALDVSGGGWVTSSNKLTSGAAGSLTVDADALYTLLPAAISTGAIIPGAGTSLLGASLSPGMGGTLSVQSGLVTIGTTSLGQSNSSDQTQAGEILLDATYFQEGGFKQYNVVGIDGVNIGQAFVQNSDGTQSLQPAPVTIQPLQQNLVFTQNQLLQPTGTSLGNFTQLETLNGIQRAPASVSIASAERQPSNSNALFPIGDVTLGAGSSIVTDPQGGVALKVGGATGNLDVEGSIVAPAGNITLQVGPVNGVTAGLFVPGQELLLGSQALLSATAVAQINSENPQGLLKGAVLSGGTVSLQANKGYIVASAGSTVDVSGADGTVDLVTSSGITPTVVAGNAGNIDIDAREGIVLQGQLLAAAAPSAGAAGGSLSIGLDLFSHLDTSQTGANNNYSNAERVLTVSAKPASQLPGVNSLSSGTAEISASAINTGGFDNVTLKSTDTIVLDGVVTLSPKSSLVLDAPNLQGSSGASASLSSNYVALGNFYNTGGSDVLTYSASAAPGTAGLPSLGSGNGLNFSPGNANLVVIGNTVDVRGDSLLNGFANTVLESTGDIRLASAQTPNSSAPYFTGSLSTAGYLTLQAAQIYPTTAVQFTINPATLVAAPTGKVTILPGSSGSSAAVPLSAGGDLVVNGAAIDQQGVLRAPLGQITLDAPTVTLAGGSVTSVSSGGQLIPFGSTQNGQQWFYDGSDLIAAPPSKQIDINGTKVAIDKGAAVDLSGGGDFYAYEFIAGPGGKNDVLSAAAQGGVYAYAILPSLGTAPAPIDPQYAAGSQGQVGKAVYLSGVPGLAAGFYTLLPPRYALLPGAFAVNIVKRSSDVLPGTVVTQPDGSYLVSARLGVAGTDIVDSRTSTVLLVPRTVVRTQSQYNDSYGDTFFGTGVATNGAAPPVAADAGQLQLAATSSLQLNGNIDFQTASFVSGRDSSGNNIVQQGRGGVASIVAPQIVVADPGAIAQGAPSDTLLLSASSLDQLGASSLILGASESSTTQGMQLSVGASTVEIRNTAANALVAPQIILAGTTSVSLDAGADVEGKGTVAGSAPTYLVSGDGALLDVSGGAQAALVRSGAPANAVGVLQIQSGATVKAAGSLILDAAFSSTVDPAASVQSPAVTLSSGQINLGDVPAGTAGLDLNNQLLSGLIGLTDLTLRSYGNIGLYGAAQLGSAAAPLNSITFDAGSLVDHGSGDKTITANTISLVDSGAGASSVAAPSAMDSGVLSLNAVTGKTGPGMIVLGAGSKTVSGFGSVQLNSSGDVRIQGNGGTLTLSGAGDLEVQAARVSTADDADQAISNSGGAVIIAPATAVAAGMALPAAGIGGRLDITASTSIHQNGVIDLPAGIVSLQAQGGDLVLGGGSTIAAAGVVKPFADTYAAAPGGQVGLIADAGNIILQSGATVDVSGAASPDSSVAGSAGSVVVSGAGTVTLGGTLKGGAAPSQMQGNFTLDAGALGGGYDALSATLSTGGFSGVLNERFRSGDVMIGPGDRVKASSFTLSADQGSIAVAGTIDTSGGTALSADGGTIGLWAGKDLTLASGAQLLSGGGSAAANARPAQGGDITLAGGGSATGSVDLQAGATIDLRGSNGTTAGNGTLVLRAPRVGSNSDLAVVEVASTINNSNTVVLEGNQVYAMPQGSTLSAGTDSGTNLSIATGGNLYTQAAQFAGNAASIEQRLFGSNPAGFNVQVRPGIEVQGAGDLALSDAWDLSQWRFNGAPVDLTLRAAGNLNFNASLSDGFGGVAPSSPLLSAGDSASYRLTAGADLAAANPMSTLSPAGFGSSGVADVSPASGNFVLSPAQLIRTGDGSIDIAAGADVLIGCTVSASCRFPIPSGKIGANSNAAQLKAQASVIYTAGTASAALTAGQGTFYSGAFYPTGGGNLTISAGRDVVSAPSNQFVSDWLWRQGSVNPTTGGIVQNTSWWVNFGTFQQGVGALGGGDVAVYAGGDVVNLSAVVPSNGRLPGAAGSAPDISQLIVNGGGSLQVQAGGDIKSGLYEDDRGNALISAGGNITTGRNISDTNPQGASRAPGYVAVDDAAVYPILVYGYDAGTFNINARADLTIEDAVNATALAEAGANTKALGTGNNSYFYTYTPDATALNLMSAAGKVSLETVTGSGVNYSGSPLDNLVPNLTTAKTTNYDNGFDSSSLGVYPAVLDIAALAGDVSLPTGVQLYPSASGTLNVLAGNSVDVPSGVVMDENDPSQVASISSPISKLSTHATALGIADYLPSVPLPLTPLHQGDTQPVRIVAATGDIDNSGGSFLFPKPAEFVAGRDIINLTYNGKNIAPNDVTLFEAGGQISFATPTDPTTNALTTNSQGIEVAGPGYVEVMAGGNLNLGDGVGIVTTGSLNDARLPTAGANLIVGAGLGMDGSGLRAPAYQSFIDAYLAPTQSGSPSAYASLLIAYMGQQLGLGSQSTLSYSDALSKFEALPVKQQLPLVAQVLYDELSATGIAHNAKGTDYSRGYTAISTLFPTQDAQGKALSYSGDINMFFSQLKTEQGGDVDLLAPGGSVVVGLPNPPGSLAGIKQSTSGGQVTVPAAANLGILVLSTGAIQGFADQNFTVNQSRVLTLEGGNIILWASNGDIDAGRGAKSASAAPPPVIETDANGNVFVNPLGAVSGSGIGQLVDTPGVQAGLVNLIAPKGDVNAGDAGIRVAGNLNIAAVVVIGADNISVGGTATGVPVSEAGALSGALSGASALGDAGKNTVDQLSQSLADAAAAGEKLAESLQPSFVVVKLFCLGKDCELQ